MNTRAVGAAIGVLLMASIVGLAVETDERNGEETSLFSASARVRESQEFVVTAEPPVELRDPEFITPPSIPPFPQGESPSFTIPEGREVVPVVPPPQFIAPAYPDPPPGQRQRAVNSGADCGTPWGENGWGAEKSATIGGVKLTLQVTPCQQYSGDFMRTVALVDNAGVVIKSIEFDYGDGERSPGGPYWMTCDNNERPNPYRADGRPHVYDNAGRYRVALRVTWATCTNGQEGPEQAGTVVIEVERRD